MFLPICALSTSPVTVTGHSTLLSRPMQATLSALQHLGVTATSDNGHLPATVAGPLSPQSVVTIDGSLSSQFVTGILYALCFSASSPVTLTVHNLTSRQYVDMTLQVLAHFGKNVANDDYRMFHITPSSFIPLADTSFSVEGDWSSVEDKEWEAAGMEVYAAMVDRMDQGK